MGNASPVIIAQISDLHLFADSQQTLLGLPTYDSLKAVLAQVSVLDPKPSHLLLTGDLSQDESQQSYEQLQALISPLATPTYWLPGNHDSCSVMSQALNQPPLCPEQSFQVGAWQILLLNSGVPGQVYGELSSASLAWLEAQLQAHQQRPTLIALHHPPLLVQSDWLDGSTLKNPQDFFAVIDRYPQVRLVIFGHIHQEFEGDRRGVRYLGSPSTCIQFQPKSATFALDHNQPGFRILQLFANGDYQTQVKRVTYDHGLDRAAQGY